MGPENLIGLNVTIACPKPESAGSVSLVLTKKEELPETWEIRTTAESEPPHLATVFLEEGKLRLTPKPLAEKTPTYQRLLLRSVLLFETKKNGSQKKVFLCIPHTSPQKGSNPTACKVSGTTIIPIGNDSYVPQPLRIEDAARMQCTLRWSSGEKTSERRLTFRNGENKVTAGAPAPALPPAQATDSFVAPVEIDGKPWTDKYPIHLLGLGFREATVALKVEAGFSSGIIRIIPTITGKEIPSWLTLESLASGKSSSQLLGKELKEIEKMLVDWDDNHNNENKEPVGAPARLKKVAKDFGLSEDTTKEVVMLGNRYMEEAALIARKKNNGRPAAPYGLMEATADWRAMVVKNPDELKTLIEKIRTEHKTTTDALLKSFAQLSDLQFEITRIESDAWLENKHYPVPLFVAAGTSTSGPATEKDKSPTQPETK